MRRPALVLVAAALVVLAADGAHKAFLLAARGDELLLHERTSGYAIGISLAALAWAVAILATRSVGLALPGGIVLGGAAGNVLSLALWPSYEGIPNTFFLGDRELGLAFNLADAFVVGAVAILLPVALAVFVARNRHRLREPVRLRG